MNNVCAAFPHQRGSVNGVTVTIESAAKALGPALGGSLYSWALEQRMPEGWPNPSKAYFGGVQPLRE